MYQDRRGGFNSQDRTLWRKDRYNAVYGRYRDKNGEYRDKNGHKLGDDNVTLLSFNNDKPFPGWANKPGSQFHPDDYPKVDADFYRNRENWPAKGLRSLSLYPFEDDWNENGVPLKNEFHDLTTLPAFNGLNPKQLPDRVDMDKVFELQQQAIQNQRYAAQQQPNQTVKTVQQIGNIVQAAAPLVAQGVSALAGAVSGVGGTDSGGSSTQGGVDSDVVRAFHGNSPSLSGNTIEAGFGSLPAGQSDFTDAEPRTREHRLNDPVPEFRTWEHRYDDPVPEVVPFAAAAGDGAAAGSNESSSSNIVAVEHGGFPGFSDSFVEVDPAAPSPEGLYGPMYPQPGIMTDQLPVVIRSGEPEVVFVEPGHSFPPPQEVNPKQSTIPSNSFESSAIDRIVDGVWDALTKGAKGAGKAFEGLAENADKIADGAELGAKMTVPVLKHTGKEILKDALSAYLSQYGWGIFKLAADFEGTHEMQIAKGVSGAKGKAQEIAEEITGIVDDYRKERGI